MFRRLILTASTTASLCGAFALYSLIVTPIFTPAPALSIVAGSESTDVAGRPAESHDEATRFLAAYPWAAEARYVWSGKHTVFAEELETNEPASEIELRPFALLLRQGKNANDEPITIVSESARLKFAEQFDRSNPKLGRVIAAALSGEVVVRGANGLAINTRNVFFSESALRVWSDHPLTFALGKNHGSAHGLELDLIPQPASNSGDKPAIEGVRTVRLRQNVDMFLIREPSPDAKQNLSAGALPPDQGVMASPADQANSQSIETAHVTSEGSFEFSLETFVASFQDRVEVQRLNDNGPPERITCDLLRLVFEQGSGTTGAAPSQSAASPSTPRSGSLTPEFGSLVFRRMRAEGKVVTLVAEQRDFSAAMRDLHYDAQTREAILLDSNGVKVFQGPNEMRCPEIRLVHTESGEIATIVCRGNGWLENRRAGARTLDFAAEWTKELRRTPDSTAKLDLLEFEGDAKLRQPGRMILSADLIKAWVTPANEKPAAAGATSTTKSDPTANVRLERVLATRNVEINSPQLTGKTERLEIEIEDGNLAPRTTTSRPTPRLPRDRLVISTWPEQRIGTPFGGSSREKALRDREQISSPNLRGSESRAAGLMQVAPMAARPSTNSSAKPISGSAPHVADRKPAKSGRPKSKVASDMPAGSAEDVPATSGKPPQRPMDVAADVIRVRVVRGPGSLGDDQYEVAEVWNEGHVLVQQAREDGSPPLQSRGEKLHLRNISETEQIVRIDGNPATIEDRGLRIEGREVHLNRGKNLAWVDGSGRLRMLVGKSLDGQPAETPQPLYVNWQEKMTFDGDMAKFYGNVVATQQDDRTRSRMKCQEMHAIFSRHVSFTADQSDAAEPEIQRVICLENVDFENAEVAGDKLIGVRRGHVFEFTLEPVSGLTSAHGPGHLIFWSLGRGNSAGLTPTATVRANQSLSSDSGEWEYIRIDFAGEMSGNSRDRFTSFRDRVRLVYGPVGQPGDVVDRDALPRHGGNMKCELLEVTQTAPHSSQPGAIQLRGSGNAWLEGRSDRTGDAVFSARADNISFDQSKGLYTLWSQGRNKATIWRESHLGGPRLCNPAQRIEFNPALNELRVFNGTGLYGVE